MAKLTVSKKLVFYLIHILLALIVILPIYFVFMSSFRPLNDIFRYLSPVTLKTFIPSSVTLEAYANLFTLRGFDRFFFNTFYVAFVSVIFGIIINSMAAFSFAFFEFKGKTLLFICVILTFLIPFEVIAIPLYIVVDYMNWIDTYWGLIVPGIANGLVIFLYRQFFLEIPRSLIEAARMDGAAWWRVFMQIVMPLCKPVTVSASLLIFIFQWEAFLWPLIVARTNEYKLIQVAMAGFVTEWATIWNEMFAAAILSVIVPAIILLVLQRYLVQGVTGTGVKG